MPNENGEAHRRGTTGGFVPALGGVAEAVAVVALGVAVGVDGFFDHKPFGAEEEGREELLYVVGVDGDNHQSRLFGYSSSSVGVKIPGCTDLDCFSVEDGRFEEGKQLVVIVAKDVNGDGVYCQLDSGQRQGECYPGGRSRGI